MMPDVCSFDQALASAVAARSKKHVLLGNGFSIALRPNNFLYGALLDEASFEGLSVEAKALFALFSTNDFERIIQHLQSGAQLSDFYSGVATPLSEALRADASAVKNALAHVLAAKHPNDPSEITDDEYASGRSFLTNFDRVYSLNYDLLIYWTSMQDAGAPVPNDDGFRSDPDDYDAPFVVWDSQAVYTSQTVFYLHGALHLFDGGDSLRKITYSRTQERLVDQIRGRLDEASYPLVVTEGESKEKLEKILHSAYLNHARRSFGSITGSLFLHGLSLSPNDEHITSLLTRGDSKIDRIFVSIHGDPTSSSNRDIMTAANRLSELRAENPRPRALDVRFYDASSARVWNAQSAP